MAPEVRRLAELASRSNGIENSYPHFSEWLASHGERKMTRRIPSVARTEFSFDGKKLTAIDLHKRRTHLRHRAHHFLIA